MKPILKSPVPQGTTPGPRAQVLGPHASQVPTDPHSILIRRGHLPRSGGRSPLFWALILGAAIEVVAPEAYKPSRLAGDAAGRFYGGIMMADNEKRLHLLAQAPVYDALGQRAADLGAWQGRCNIIAQFDPTFGFHCHQAVDNFYHDAIGETRRAQRQFGEAFK